MKMMAFGGDERMRGALEAAKKAGWETLHAREAEDIGEDAGAADAVILPWPVSFREGRLVGGGMSREEVLARIPPCKAVLLGDGVSEGDLPLAGMCVNPQRDEDFLRENAQLTAEGAIIAAVHKAQRALLHKTCLVTGFGRIGQEVTARLCAMGAFVIVCARSEAQMRAAHQMGAHPVPLLQMASACGQADIVMNTVPARVIGEDALRRLAGRALLMELASAPYGADIEQARAMGVNVIVESGLPGRYAPMEAGAALFGALMRAMEKGEERHG